MQGLGETPTEEKINDLIQQIDYDGDGVVDFDEFVCLMVKTLYEADKAEEELVTVFKKFDKDGNGEITPIDLMESFRELGYDCDEKEATDMIHFFDKDKDGYDDTLTKAEKRRLSRKVQRENFSKIRKEKIKIAEEKRKALEALVFYRADRYTY